MRRKTFLPKIIAAFTAFAMTIGFVATIANSKRILRVDASSPATLTFNAACGGSGTDSDGNTWTITSDAAESTFDSTKGIHYGTGSKVVSYLNLTTSGITGTITQIVVNASGASSTTAVLNVTVGGSAFDTEKSLTTTATNYTLSGSASGTIVVAITQSSAKRAIYCKSIAVSYTSGGGGGGSSSSEAPATYTVTYNANGGTGTLTDSNSPYSANASVTVLANTFTYTHHTFSNWNTSADGNGTSYNPGNTFNISANTILYAQWASDPSYTISYHDTNKTSGDVPVDNTSHYEGDEVTLLGNTNTLARDGYVWSGWSLNEDGSGLAYGPTYITKYTIGTSNVDFYPIWLPAYDEELAFHFAGSTVHGSETGYDAREATVDSQSDAHYDSAHWQITVGNNTAELGTNSKAANLGKATLNYGTFAAAEGLASAIGVTVATPKYSAAICTTPMTDIYEIDLFYTGTNGNPTTIWVLSSTNGTTWEVEAEKTNSIPTESKFTFFKNDDARQYAMVVYWNLTNSGGLKGFELKLFGDYPNPQTISGATEAYSDSTIALSSNAPSPTWSIVAADTTAPGAAVSNAGVVSVTGAGTVKVKAAKNGYEDAYHVMTFTERPAGTFYDVTFDSNGGSNNPDTINLLENTTFVFPSAGTKEHYSFDGWTSTGSAPYYAVGATSPAVTGNITYTAHWTEDAKYTVTYNADSNGTGSYADADHYAGTYTLLAFNALGITPNSGYQFKDYTVNDAHKNPGEEITISANTTITVNFEEIGYNVTFGTADGSAGLTGLTNTSYVIPDGVTLDNIQGNVYGKNDNTSSAIRFGKSGTTGSFDVTIDSQYYIKKIIANLKYYSSDSTAKFAVTPDGEDAIEKTLTNAFLDYEYDVSDAYTNKVTLGTTSEGKRAYLASFKITYGVKTALGTIEHTKTNTLLNYQYEQVNEGLTYTHVGIRFGGYIAKSLFNQIDNIQGYGVICAIDPALGSQTIKQLYEEALDVAEGNIDDAFDLMNDDATIRVFSSTTAQPQEASDADYYKWNLYKEIIVTGEGLSEQQVTNKLTQTYTAVAFIKTSTSIIFFKQVTVSAASIADKLIDSGSQPIDAYDGSLKHLADLLGE